MTKKTVSNGMALSSNLVLVNPSLKLMKIIGSPLTPGKKVVTSSEEAMELYHLAVKNKIPMLYMEALRQQGKLGELEATYQEGKAKYLTFIDAVARVSKVLEATGDRFAIYKTIKPYPAVPNDIDIIILGNTNEYRHAAETLLRARYQVALPGVVETESLTDDDAYRRAARLAIKPTSYKHEHISPSATNFIETEHHTSIDLHKEIAMNHTVYMDKNNFEGHVVKTRLSNGEDINTLTPELDLACMAAHSLMEHLYLLEGYYSFLFKLSKMSASEIGRFTTIVKENRITLAARAFTTVTARLCQAAYGVIPEEVHLVADRLGSDNHELENTVSNDFTTPHRYKVLTVVRMLLEKTKEGRFRRSVLKQVISMLNPLQAKLVVSELIDRRRREKY